MIVKLASNFFSVSTDITERKYLLFVLNLDFIPVFFFFFANTNYLIYSILLSIKNIWDLMYAVW